VDRDESGQRRRAAVVMTVLIRCGSAGYQLRVARVVDTAGSGAIGHGDQSLSTSDMNLLHHFCIS